MFSEEAKWIEQALQMIIINDDKTAINFGSSTLYFREHIQPHIQNYIFGPLEKKGWNILHVDIKKGEGIDMVADLTDASFNTSFKVKAALVICTNMLEHVTDIKLAVNNLITACKQNGYMLITVPYKYKKHLDPIDNMFRPTPAEIADLFTHANVNVIDDGIITIEDKSYYRIKKSAIPFWGYRERLLYYLGKRHKVSAVLLKLNGVS